MSHGHFFPAGFFWVTHNSLSKRGPNHYLDAKRNACIPLGSDVSKSIAGSPPPTTALNLPVPIYTPEWREAL